MIGEEDFNPSISDYLPQLYEAKQKAKLVGKEFNMYFHAGESNAKSNKELYHAIALGTKRIGHGYHLAYHPSLHHIVRERKICIECCPVNNFVMGFVNDLRTHPGRAFLHQGIPMTIGSADPAFMAYDGVTLDYLYAFISWDLDLADLKQLAINSLQYSSLSDNEKKAIFEFFKYKWGRFLEFIITRYWGDKGGIIEEEKWEIGDLFLNR